MAALGTLVETFMFEHCELSRGIQVLLSLFQQPAMLNINEADNQVNFRLVNFDV